MNIELIPEPTFTVRANGNEIRGMKVISEWKGLRELQDGEGRTLIIANTCSPMQNALRDAFQGISNEGATQCYIVMGHPDLAMELTTGAKVTAPLSAKA